MKRTGTCAAAVIAIVLFSPASARAANKEHQQLMAEIRMLQEQQQQLQQLLGGLADTLKTVTAKIDDQTSANRKAFADQKLLIDGVGEGVRILREKADDTNVRLSSMTQELESLRQTITAHQAAPILPAPGTEPPSIDPTAPPVTTIPTAPAPGSASVPTPNVSHQKMYDNSLADYAAGQWELAVAGFESYIRMFPRSPLADDAQLNIGNSHYSEGRFKDAVEAFQKVVRDYPQSDSVPAAWYKLGLTYDRLGQPDLARKAFETVMKNFPTASEAFLAKQRLDSLNRGRLF